jgi:hypothetical protein
LAPATQPRVDALVVTNQYAEALQVLNDDADLYGKNSALLYVLDKGYIQHLNNAFPESIETFAAAKEKFEELYTKSVSSIATTWLINDYAAPYRGEDFERVFINIFQAINYLMLDNLSEALVEARDVDSTLNAINSQYQDDQKNVYKEDAFVRLLVGILYEAGGRRDNLNDAYIAYVKSGDIYNHDYTDNYGVPAPNILKENILTAARFMGLSDFSEYRSAYPQTKFVSIEEKRKKAEVYFIQYNGLSPVKIEESLIIPTLDGHVLKVAFPVYRERPYGIASSRLVAKPLTGQNLYADSELVQDIGYIARKDLERRKLRFIVKSAARSAGKYLVGKKQGENIKKKHGIGAADLFGFISNIYNIISERADLRSWQTLPDQIRMARLLLEQGEYEFSVENFSASGSHLGEIPLKKISVSAGQKVFLMVHTTPLARIFHIPLRRTKRAYSGCRLSVTEFSAGEKP